MQTILQLSIKEHKHVGLLSNYAQLLLGTSGSIALNDIMNSAGYSNNSIIRVKSASLGFIDTRVQLIVDFVFDNENTGEDDTASFYISVGENNQLVGDY